MPDMTMLDRTRSAADMAHDAGRFKRLGLTSENILARLAHDASEVAGWGAGNEAATMRFAMQEIVRLRAILSPTTAPANPAEGGSVE